MERYAALAVTLPGPRPVTSVAVYPSQSLTSATWTTTEPSATAQHIMKRFLLAVTLTLVACAPGLPGPEDGSRATAPSSGELWDPARVERDAIPTSPPTVVDSGI